MTKKKKKEFRGGHKIKEFKRNHKVSCPEVGGGYDTHTAFPSFIQLLVILKKGEEGTASSLPCQSFSSFSLFSLKEKCTVFALPMRVRGGVPPIIHPQNEKSTFSFHPLPTPMLRVIVQILSSNIHNCFSCPSQSLPRGTFTSQGEDKVGDGKTSSSRSLDGII